MQQWLKLFKNIKFFKLKKMTNMILPSMIKKRRGLIMNISSISAMRPYPFMTVYGATKSFVDYFSRALSIECETSGVEVIVSVQGSI